MKRLLLICSSFVFAFVLAELGIRVAGFRPTLLNSEMFVPGSPYRLKANMTTEYVGKTVKTDADGNRVVPNLRDPSVVLLGDSIVFGQGLDDGETIASQLGIANISAPGYTSWNEYDRLREYVSKHQVKRVILVYVPNDITFNNEAFSKANFGVSESKVHRASRWLYSHIYVTFLIKNSVTSLTSRQSGSSAIDWNALDYSMDAVSQIGQLKPLAVGIYRDVWYYHDPTAREFESRVMKALSSRGIDHFVIKSHIEQLRESEVRLAWNDPHPSSEAVRLIAQDIAAGVNLQVLR